MIKELALAAFLLVSQQQSICGEVTEWTLHGVTPKALEIICGKPEPCTSRVDDTFCVTYVDNETHDWYWEYRYYLMWGNYAEGLPALDGLE